MNSNQKKRPSSASFAAIITAAGSSARFGGIKKEFLPLPGGLSVLGTAARAFAAFPAIETIVITTNPGEHGEAQARAALPPELLRRPDEGAGPRVLFVPGGPTRRASVHHGLSLLAAYAPDYVLIHDGARPWVSAALIERVMAAVTRHGAAIPLLPLTDTPKETDGGGLITRHLRRGRTGGAQTPQAFRFPAILAAHDKAAAEELAGREFTDDAEVWGAFSGAGEVAAVEGETANKKITYAGDIEDILEGLSTGSAGRHVGRHAGRRVGLGRDIHRLEEGRRFLLAGVALPSPRGMLGYSDGDVLAHAVMDALLGASALGDIGEWFPPGDPRWKDADSMLLLARVWAAVKEAGWGLGNLDCVVSCEEPRVLPYRGAIRESLARALDAEEAAVFVKGKTGEGLGPVGEGRAVEAVAVCLLEKR